MSRQSAAERLKLIGSRLGAGNLHGTTTELVTGLVGQLREPDDAHSYLILAVLRAEIPLPELVRETTRRWRTEGLQPILRAELVRLSRHPRTPRVIVESSILVDVTDTARSRFMTGIQRVARESLKRWPLEQVRLVCWDRVKRRLHEAAPAESSLVLGAGAGAGAGAARGSKTVGEVLIPFRATVVLPEIAVDSTRYTALRTIARYSRSKSFAIGFDCIPITTGEVAAPGMSGAFASYLATLASFDEIVAISAAAAREFRGWAAMLGGAGLQGPRIDSLELPFSAEAVDAETQERVRSQLALEPDVPIVLAIGSHEPRKNHVAFLHAAELMWRAGHEFTVVMVGGNSWNADIFMQLVKELRAIGRRIVTVSGADDEVVWSLYQLARFSVFCSLNEGFGLPVAESLAAGTPVITSGFGSMKSLAEGHGSLLVDPRDARAIAGAMEQLLSDDDMLKLLERETVTLSRTSWDDYARELWMRVAGLARDAA